MPIFLKRVFILFVAACCISPLFAADNKNINQYFELINKAELAICSGHQQEALTLYNKAYNIRGDKMTSRHLYNYFALCADLHNWPKCKQLLTILKKREWEMEHYETAINSFDAATQVQLRKLYADISVVPTVRKDLRAIADSLAHIDQVTNKYLRSQNNGLLEGAAGDSFHKLTDSNMVFLARLFAHHFPGDDEMGRMIYPYGKLPYMAILHHNWQGHNRRDMDNILYRAMKEGKIAPDEFDYWVSMYNYTRSTDTMLVFDNKELKVPLFPINFIIYQDSLFQFGKESSKIQSCNMYRQTIPGLCTVEELKRKIIFQHYNKQYHFVLTEYIDHMGEEARRLRKHFIYLPAN